MRTIVGILGIACLAISGLAVAQDRFNGVKQVDLSQLNVDRLLDRYDRVLQTLEVLERNTPDDARLAEAINELDIEALLGAGGDDEEESDVAALLCKVPAEKLLTRIARLVKIAPRFVQAMESEEEHIENIEQEVLAPSLVLLLINAARTQAGCETQALRLLEFARRDWQFSKQTNRRFFDAVADAVSMGLRFRLDQQSKGHSSINAAQMLRASKKVSSYAAQVNFDAPVDSLERYETDLEHVIATRRSPIWRVQGLENAKLDRRMRTCGFVSLGSFDLPAFPSPTEFLYADGQKQAAAAWALAHIFKLPEAEKSHSSLNYAEFVFAAYGKENTVLEIERAARSIYLTEWKDAPPLAYIRFFEHQFIISSGVDAAQSASGKAVIYTPAEIEQHFRESTFFRQLSGN